MKLDEGLDSNTLVLPASQIWPIQDIVRSTETDHLGSMGGSSRFLYRESNW